MDCRCQNVVTTVFYGVVLSTMIAGIGGIVSKIESHLFSFAMSLSWTLYVTAYFIDEISYENRESVAVQSLLCDTLGWVMFSCLGMTITMPVTNLCVGCLGVVLVSISLGVRIHDRCLTKRESVCLYKFNLCELCKHNSVEVGWILENVVFVVFECLLVLFHACVKYSQIERMPLFILVVCAFCLMFFMKVSKAIERVR